MSYELNKKTLLNSKVIAGIFFVLFIICTNSANIIFKYAFIGKHFDNYWHILKYIFFSYEIWSGILLYFFSTIFWLVALKEFDLSFIYILVAINYPIIQFLSWFFFGEEIGIKRIIGIVIIIIGIINLFRDRDKCKA